MTIIAVVSRFKLSAHRFEYLSQFGDVLNVCNDCQLDRARWSLLSGCWARAVKEPMIWVDDDVHVAPETITGLHRIREEIGCAVYNVRNSHEIACNPSGPARNDGLVPLRWCHFGATIVRPSVWFKLFHRSVPVVKGVPAPWFPLVRDDQYLGDDVAFCLRAADLGVSMFADPNLVCAHGWPEREFPSEGQLNLLTRGERLCWRGAPAVGPDFDVRVERFVPDDPERRLPPAYGGDAGGKWVFDRTDRPSTPTPGSSSRATTGSGELPPNSERAVA